MSTYLAVDFGAGSGRVIAGRYVDNDLQLDELHRFRNRQIKIGRHLYWDFPSLFEDMKDGLRKAAQKYNDIVSIGIDTWGVDFGLIDKTGALIGNPICYRDDWTDGLPEEVFRNIDIKKHYSETGIQVMAINSMFQLVARRKENEAVFEQAEHLLFMPDLMAYYLTGVPGNEYCIASTSELLDARSRSWNKSLICELGLPEHIFGNILQPGTARGRLTPAVARELGLSEEVKVYAVASHDTASAVYAVPFREGRRSAFLSSGTWSLLGTVLDEPILTEEARLAGFTNEGGVDGKIRFLQNITGLWILQCLIAEWSSQELDTDYDFLISEAEKVEDAAYINVDSAAFSKPESMAKAIADDCLARGVKVPQSQGEYVRCVLQSLAERYRTAIEHLNRLIPEPIECLHIIGGGCRNRLLNRLTEEALGIPVIAGPVEATAMGNIMLQMRSEKK